VPQTYSGWLFFIILYRDWWLFNNKLPAWRSCLSLNSFITVKLSSKLVSQLQDLPTVASCNIPTWCYEAAEKFPFLFTFESRVLFMRVTAFGGFRGLNYLAKSQYAGQSVGSTFLRSFSLKRIKIKIERERVFESFMKIVEEHFDSKTSLEIDFLNEVFIHLPIISVYLLLLTWLFWQVGSGLGPTLEFFTLCSNEFKRRDLNMWWKDTYHEPLHSSKYVTFLAGLFPKFTTDPSDKVLKYFSSLGTFCAKALADQRLVDILFSPVFWLLSIGGKDQIAQLCVASLADIDYRLFTSLKALQQIVDERKFYEKEDNIIKLAEVDQHVENMSISWSYPGHADVIMKTSNEFVSGKELEEYIFSVAHYTFFVGCTQQIQAFVSGWNKVCSIKVLQSFTPEGIYYYYSYYYSLYFI
jgi:E3 ubiquitin-protein ligase TRIP12